MKVFEFRLKPTSDFATELQGDCLFGQICWQFAQDNSLAGNITNLLAEYDTNPFCVVADPCLTFEKDGRHEYLLKMPFFKRCHEQNENEKNDFEQQKRHYLERKRKKSFKWVIVSENMKLNLFDETNLVDAKIVKTRYGCPEEWRIIKATRQTHNSINRLTGTTGTGAFAPYTSNIFSWPPKTEFALFIGIRDDIEANAVGEALRRIGITGYGADASTGKGRFEVISQPVAVDLSLFGSQTPDSLYVLSPILPETGIYEKVCFEPFVRFGRHGNILATSNAPFKQPVLKAATGAILTPEKNKWPMRLFIGKSINGISKHKATVEQGYALFIPVKSEA